MIAWCRPSRIESILVFDESSALAAVRIAWPWFSKRWVRLWICSSSPRETSRSVCVWLVRMETASFDCAPT